MNTHFIKGRAEGARIPLEPVGPALVMTDSDFDRLIEDLRRDGYTIPEPETAASR